MVFISPAQQSRHTIINISTVFYSSMTSQFDVTFILKERERARERDARAVFLW